MFGGEVGAFGEEASPPPPLDRTLLYRVECEQAVECESDPCVNTSHAQAVTIELNFSGLESRPIGYSSDLQLVLLNTKYHKL